MEASPELERLEHPDAQPAYEVSSTHSGLITIRWLRAATDEESEALMRWFSSFWAAEKPYVVAMITHPDAEADARHRRRWAEWHEAHREALARYCRGVAIAGQSASIRALMTMMSWFSKGCYETRYVATEREARAWAASQLLSA